MSMTVQFTCKQCGSGIHVYPSLDAHKIICDVCQTEHPVHFHQNDIEGNLKSCPSCERLDFYSQKDFSRKVGVSLFVLAALISTWMLWKGLGPQWYLSTFIILYLADLLLFKKLKMIAVCYKCETIFRNVNNIGHFQGFSHEMHDRIVYSDHNFEGKPLDH